MAQGLPDSERRNDFWLEPAAYHVLPGPAFRQSLCSAGRIDRTFVCSISPCSRVRDSPLRKPIWATDSLTLTHEQSIFTVEFAALSYAAPEKNRYRYRLEGLETDWNEVDSRQRLATYTSLPAGNYVFGCRDPTTTGVEREGRDPAITVLPPWWATWWFRCIAGLTCVGLVLAVYRSRVRGLHLAAARLEAQVERTSAERTRELQSPRKRRRQPTGPRAFSWPT